MASSQDRPSVHAGFLTAYPLSGRSLTELLRVLLSRGSDYRPELIEMSDVKGKRYRFDVHDLENLSRRWDSARLPIVWDILSNGSSRLLVNLAKGPLPFDPVVAHMNREFFGSKVKVAGFLEVLKQFYDLLHPAYGDAQIREMKTPYDHPKLGKITPGTDLERGLPDVYWANFLGPEYVEMFGKDKVYSAPCHSVEPLSDGGALLLLSPSPLDYLSDRERLDRQRSDIKEHLGVEAFDTGDFHFRGKVPRFRYLEERKATIERWAPIERMARQAGRAGPENELSDWLSTVGRGDWEKWVENNRSLSEDFIREMEQRGVGLDLSKQSLKKVDEYLASLRKSSTAPNVEFLKKLAAFVSQVVIQQTGANWSFKMSEDIPSLTLGKIHMSPLARTQKALLEGETFEHWYRFLTKELIPKVKTGNSS